jgi:hypothetical protein
MCSRSPRTILRVVLAFGCAAIVPAQKFLPDDPIQVDHDNRDIPAPKRHKLNDYYDFVENSFWTPGDRMPRTAMNINTLGEVPDSSWYTNRHARRRMSIQELVRGPDRGTGPAPGVWTVLRGKNEGVTPGFSFIRDSRGDLYAIKFDPPGHLEMSSSADVIGTKFFYAMGYHVPENYIVYFRAEQLELGESATFTDAQGRERKMDHRDIQEVLNRVARTTDGRYRAVASKILPGQDLGPFRYYGTRPDDPNDIFPHEHRRELRGLWVLSAWLNHDDSRAINTLDMLVKENGRQFIRHHLIDFGSILGSGSVMEQKPRAGNEYLWEVGPTFARILTLGLWDRHWILMKYPHYPSIGKIESKFFRPERWKPEYPNAAFRNCLPEDAYWAAKIVMSFTDDEIRAIVRTGQISYEEAEDYLIRCILERRDKVGRYWLNQVNSTDNFRIDAAAGKLHFEDVAVRYRVAEPPMAYRAQWLLYDNKRDQKTRLGPAADYATSPIPIPPEVLNGPEGSYFSLQIRRLVKQNPKIPKAVHVYFRQDGGRLKLVGLEREE